MARDGSEAGAAEAQFEHGRLGEISGGDAEFEREIAGEYVTQAWGLLAEIAAAIERGDPELLRRCAHTLKGSSRTIGANGVGEMAAQLEKLAGNAGPLAATLVGRIRTALTSTQQILDRYFGSDAYRRAA